MTGGGASLVGVSLAVAVAALMALLGDPRTAGYLLAGTLAVLALARAPAGQPRLPLALLVAGLVLNSVADSGFVYLTATEGYEPGAALDVIWSLGLGSLALAALLDHHVTDRRGAGHRPTTTSAATSRYRSRPAMALKCATSTSGMSANAASMLW